MGPAFLVNALLAVFFFAQIYVDEDRYFSLK